MLHRSNVLYIAFLLTHKTTLEMNTNTHIEDTSDQPRKLFVKSDEPDEISFDEFHSQELRFITDYVPVCYHPLIVNTPDPTIRYALWNHYRLFSTNKPTSFDVKP